MQLFEYWYDFMYVYQSYSYFINICHFLTSNKRQIMLSPHPPSSWERVNCLLILQQFYINSVSRNNINHCSLANLELSASIAQQTLTAFLFIGDSKTLAGRRFWSSMKGLCNFCLEK